MLSELPICTGSCLEKPAQDSPKSMAVCPGPEGDFWPRYNVYNGLISFLCRLCIRLQDSVQVRSIGEASSYDVIQDPSGCAGLLQIYETHHVTQAAGKTSRLTLTISPDFPLESTGFFREALNPFFGAQDVGISKFQSACLHSRF